MEPRFSICIPAWEQGGAGVTHLKRLVDSVLSQTLQDYEIVISDHSKNNQIEEYVSGLDKAVYSRYTSNYGNGPANTNNSLRMASGQIIKVMFQDDFMFSTKCLEAFNDEFSKPEVKWAVCGCNHTKNGKSFYRRMVPRWHNRMLDGPNTISSPSVIAFINEDVEFFDEKLIMRMDLEYYYRLGQRYGAPKIISNCLVSNGIHGNQISRNYKMDVKKEIEYSLEKHRRKG